MFVTDPDVTSQVQALAMGYNTRGITLLQSYYSRNGAPFGHTAAQLNKLRKFGFSDPIDIPKHLAMMFEFPEIQLRTIRISGNRDLVVWEWEYDMVYSKPLPCYPGVPIGQILTMKGVSVISFGDEGGCWKVDYQREYGSLVDWTDAIGGSWARKDAPSSFPPPAYPTPGLQQF
ncbi:hypothetical protein N7G274_006315 [Stereocaulon virgatum]|uniref:Uncharacterized protein n=1 Tax=Stereocaulon virgatum TaxID=373712 RepID=A0ABR4A4M8_9LECA